MEPLSLFIRKYVPHQINRILTFLVSIVPPVFPPSSLLLPVFRSVQMLLVFLSLNNLFACYLPTVFPLLKSMLCFPMQDSRSNVNRVITVFRHRVLRCYTPLFKFGNVRGDIFRPAKHVNPFNDQNQRGFQFVHGVGSLMLFPRRRFPCMSHLRHALTPMGIMYLSQLAG